MTTDPEWHRPHPLTIAVSAILFVANNLLPVVFLIAAGAGAGLDLVAVFVGAGTLLVGVAQWYATRYAITDLAVEYRSGVLNRQSKSIPLDRIQQVSVAQPVVPRVFGLAAVQVSEASADGDVAISYLDINRANELTQTLRSLARERDATATVAYAGGSPVGAGDASMPPPPPPPPAYPIHRSDLGDVVRYQLAVTAPGFAVGVGLVMLAGAVVAVASGPTPGLLAIPIALLIVVAIAAMTVVTPLLTLGGFELHRGDRGLMVDMGLLSKRHLEVRPDRVQTATVVSGPIARRAGLHQVVFSAAVGNATPRSSVAHLGPAVRTEHVTDLMRQAFDLEPGFEALLEPVSRLTVRRFLVRSGLAYLIIGLPASVAGAITIHPLAAALLTTTWAASSVVWARARFRRLGVSVDAGRIVMRQGVMLHRLTQISMVNVQSVTMRSSYFQRRLGLQDLVVATAGIGPAHMVRVPDLPTERAQAMAHLLAVTAADSRWELGR